jgi:hypothetical protein
MILYSLDTPKNTSKLMSIAFQVNIGSCNVAMQQSLTIFDEPLQNPSALLLVSVML